jgi:superfamily II DNA/RNA helicase
MTFTELGTSPALTAILKARGIESPTEVQKLVFTPIVEGKSVLGLSKTGSGKTLAYLLPLVQGLLADLDQKKPAEASADDVAVQNDAEKSRVLILCPTRELAHQIHSELQLLMPERTGASLLIVGGDSEQEQRDGFRQSLFVVATPGRLLDLIKNAGMPLGSFQRVVLDEADRLLDMGFQEDIRDILTRIPKGFQLVCLSATLHLGVEELIYEMGVDFVRVKASSDADLTVEGLDHRVVFVGDQEKFHFLANFLKDRQDQRGIIFSNFREAAHRISKRLEGLGYRAEALSAQLSQPQRRKIMEEFRAERLDILVASDVAARGLDVDALDYVVNFELPDDSSTYVHRVGRTARAGRQGVAVSMVGFEDSYRLEKLESYLKMPILRMTVDTSWLQGSLPRGKHVAPSRNAQQPRQHQKPERHSQPARQKVEPRANTSKPNSTKPKTWFQGAVAKFLKFVGVRSAPASEVGVSSGSSQQRPAAKESNSGSNHRGKASGGGHSERGGRGGPRREGGRRRPRPAGPRRGGER